MQEPLTLDGLTIPDLNTCVGIPIPHHIESGGSSQKKDGLNQLFDSLPDLLLKGTQPFKKEEEKILFLFLCVSAVSGLATNVTGTYRQRTEHANLYGVGIGRPASGKGLIDYVQLLLTKVQEHFLGKAMTDSKKYQAELAAYKFNKKVNPNLGPPLRPAFKVPLIPANCTSAKLVQHLQDNQPDVPQVMIESEIDALVGALEADLVNISTILRKNFHGESISVSRKTDSEYVYIHNCQLAIAMVGTSNQFLKLANNRSDGLLSRFLVFVIDSPPVVSGIKPNAAQPNLTEYFTKLSDDVFTFWTFLKQEAFEVELQSWQWDTLQVYLEEKMQETIANHGDEASQIIMRHGVMCFKICMVLTALRKFENAESAPKITCTNDDFVTALQLIDLSIKHSLTFFEALPDVGLKVKTLQKQTFLNALPETFNRKDALAEAKALNLSEPSVDRYLRKLAEEGKISALGKGEYQKR